MLKKLLSPVFNLLAFFVGGSPRKDAASNKRAGLLGMYFQESNARRNKVNRQRQ